MDNNNEYKKNYGDILSNVNDYSSMKSYEGSVSSDLGNLGNLGDLGSVSDYSYGSSSGTYQASVEEPESPAPSDGLSPGVYQALYSDYDSSQANNYRTSLYSAPSDTDSSQVNTSRVTDDYQEYQATSVTDDYQEYQASSETDDDEDYEYQASSETDRYKTYDAPEETDFGSASASSYGHQEYGASENGETAAGRPPKNPFAVKMVLSLVELLFATLWGILGLIFTCMANRAYQREDWESFKKKSRVASIMLCIGLILSVANLAVIGMFFSRGAAGNGGSLAANGYVQERGADDETAGVEEVPAAGDTQTGEVQTDVTQAKTKAYNSFKLNGTKLTVPDKISGYVKVLSKCGYEFSDSLNKTKLGPHEEMYLNFQNKDGYIAGFVEAYNTTEEEITAAEGIVGGFYMDTSLDKKISIDYMGKLDNNSKPEAYIDILGTPDSADESYGYYQWYTDEGWISVDIVDGKLESFTIYAYQQLEN